MVKDYQLNIVEGNETYTVSIRIFEEPFTNIKKETTYNFCIPKIGSFENLEQPARELFNHIKQYLDD